MCRSKLALMMLLGFLSVEEFRARSVILHYTLGIYKLTTTDSDSSFYCWVSHSSHRHLKRTFFIIKQIDFHSDTLGAIGNLTLCVASHWLCWLGFAPHALWLHFAEHPCFLSVLLWSAHGAVSAHLSGHCVSHAMLYCKFCSRSVQCTNEQAGDGLLPRKTEVLWESWWKAWRNSSFGGREGYVLLETGQTPREKCGKRQETDFMNSWIWYV